MIWFYMMVLFAVSFVSAAISIHTWWIYLPLAIGFGITMKSAPRAFFGAAIASAMVWVMIAYYQDMRSQGIISRRMSEMFGLPAPLLIFPVLMLIAGISSGLFAVLGYHLNKSFLETSSAQKS